jgi:hypothetical protein
MQAALSAADNDGFNGDSANTARIALGTRLDDLVTLGATVDVLATTAGAAAVG